mmetsp:Transcript_73801/g.193587  ORF Transcript_73801/g.193587 Transcript_73801/m.193587 type:complete len:412 (-) Transcript_73801:1302-2537(-)
MPHLDARVHGDADGRVGAGRRRQRVGCHLQHHVCHGDRHDLGRLVDHAQDCVRPDLYHGPHPHQPVPLRHQGGPHHIRRPVGEELRDRQLRAEEGEQPGAHPGGRDGLSSRDLGLPHGGVPPEPLQQHQRLQPGVPRCGRDGRQHGHPQIPQELPGTPRGVAVPQPHPPHVRRRRQHGRPEALRAACCRAGRGHAGPDHAAHRQRRQPQHHAHALDPDRGSACPRHLHAPRLAARPVDPGFAWQQLQRPEHRRLQVLPPRQDVRHARLPGPGLQPLQDLRRGPPQAQAVAGGVRGEPGLRALRGGALPRLRRRRLHRGRAGRAGAVGERRRAPHRADRAVPGHARPLRARPPGLRLRVRDERRVHCLGRLHRARPVVDRAVPGRRAAGGGRQGQQHTASARAGGHEGGQYG